MFSNKSEIINRIGNIKGIKHSKEQLDILNHGGGMVVVAGAGSGKTTTITDLMYVLIETGEADPSKMLCTTYSKGGATEMNNKFKSLCNKMGKKPYDVTVKTLHAVYYQILSYLGYKLNICSESNINTYIRKCLGEAGLNSKDNELVDYTKQLLSYQVNRALSDDELVDSFIFDLSIMNKEQFALIRNKFSELKRADNVVDFDDLQLQLYNLLYFYEDYSKQVIEYCHSQWDFFIIDEFQDTSMIQYRIFKKMADKSYSNRIVLIGDDDQAIYVWRGTDPNIMLEEVRLDYTLDKLVLPTNYRCKSNIVEFAANSVRNLSRRENKQLVAFDNGGEVEYVDMPYGVGLYEMSLRAKNYIRDLIADGVKPSEIAVLSRNNNQVQLLNSLLIGNGIYTSTVSENMKLTKSMLYGDFMSAIEFSEDTFDSNKVKNTLWKVVPYLNKAGSNLIGDIMFTLGISLSKALAYAFVASNSWMATDEMRDDADTIKTVNYKLISKIEYTFSNIKQEIKASLVEMYSTIKDSNRDTKEKSLVFLYRCYESMMFMYNTSERRRYLQGFYKFFKALLNSDDYLKKLNTIEQIESGMFGVVADEVDISTIHSAKGMEWKYVILFCCDYLSLPSLEYIKTMGKKMYTTEDIVNFIDCERRLYYVGCTRAKEKLVIIGDPRRLCPFLLESKNVTFGNSRDYNRDIIALANCDDGYKESTVKDFKANMGITDNSNSDSSDSSVA